MADPNVSSGTCYSATDEESPGDMLPCGNAELGHQSCCQAGDMCLDGWYCYNEEHVVTYLAGCSDPEYKDDRCPPTLDPEHPWVRVYFCVTETDLFIRHCDRARTPGTIDDLDRCSWPKVGGEAMKVDDTYFDDIALLPASAGESVAWQSGYAPTATGKPSPTENNSEWDGGGLGEGLGVGAKAGIGVGVSLAGLFIVGIICLLLRRRKRVTTRDTDGEGPKSAIPTFFRRIKGGAGAAKGEKAALEDLGPLPAELPVRSLTPPPSELWADDPASTVSGEGSPGSRSGITAGDGVGTGRRNSRVVSELS